MKVARQFIAWPPSFSLRDKARQPVRDRARQPPPRQNATLLVRGIEPDEPIRNLNSDQRELVSVGCHTNDV